VLKTMIPKTSGAKNEMRVSFGCFEIGLSASRDREISWRTLYRYRHLIGVLFVTLETCFNKIKYESVHAINTLRRAKKNAYEEFVEGFVLYTRWAVLHNPTE
jgi:hypothetical protein